MIECVKNSISSNQLLIDVIKSLNKAFVIIVQLIWSPVNGGAISETKIVLNYPPSNGSYLNYRKYDCKAFQFKSNRQKLHNGLEKDRNRQIRGWVYLHGHLPCEEGHFSLFTRFRQVALCTMPFFCLVEFGVDCVGLWSFIVILKT